MENSPKHPSKPEEFVAAYNQAVDRRDDADKKFHQKRESADDYLSGGYDFELADRLRDESDEAGRDALIAEADRQKADTASEAHFREHENEYREAAKAEDIARSSEQ